MFIYTGHAMLDKTNNLLLRGACDANYELQGPRINWTRNRAIFDVYNHGQVLLVMDCCFLTAAIAGHDGPEILAASVFVT